MSVKMFRGHPVLEYNGRRYRTDSKTFERVVNAERKQGRRLFETLSIGAVLYAVNPVTEGKGSASPLVEIETDLKGNPTKRGAKRLEEINRAWTAFVEAGKEYNLQYDVSYNVDITLRNGATVVRPIEKSFPAAARAGTLPKTFGRGGKFKPTVNMTKAELIEYLNESVVRVQYSDISPPENIKVKRLRADAVSGTALGDIPMNALKFLYKSIGNNLETRPGSCVADYILSELYKPNTNLRHVTRPMVASLKTTNKIIEWAKTMECISVYALDPLFRVFDKHNAKEARVTLMFVVNNNHLYPITDETQRKQVRSSQRLQLEAVDFAKVDLEDALYCDELEYLTPKDKHCIRDDERRDRIGRMVDFVLAADKHVVLPEDSLKAVASGVMEATNSLVEHFHYSAGALVCFQHPTKGVCVIAGRDYHQRRAICADYFKKNKVIDFTFKNQGWGEIGRTILTNCYGEISSSNYSPDLKHVFQSYPIRPYRMCNDTSAKGTTSIDIHRCYPAGLLSIDEFNVFGSFDSIRPYTFTTMDRMKPGEYYISKDFFMGRGTIFVSKGFYPKTFVTHVLGRGYVVGSDITYALLADKCLKGDTFKSFVNDLYKAYPDDSKALINYTIGCFGSLHTRKTRAGVTTDFDTAMATIADKPHSVLYELTELDGVEGAYRLFIIQENDQCIKDYGDVPIYRQVIASSLVQLDKMVETLNVASKDIVGYNTDAIKVRARSEYNISATKAKDECSIGEYHVEESKTLSGRTVEALDRFEAYVYTDVKCEVTTEEGVDIERVVRRGAFITGMPGCGKTEFVKTIVGALTQEERNSTVVLSYTNAAVENLRKRLDGFDVQIETLSGFLWNGKTLTTAPLASVKRVILDEYSMLPPFEMGLLLTAQQKYGTVIICLGDSNQCRAPVDNWVDYGNNTAFIKMCGAYEVVMAYKPGFARYDAELYAALRRFSVTKKLDDWECDAVESYQNICYTNKKRVELNKQCFKRWVQAHSTKVVSFGFDVCVGLPVMAYDDTNKLLGIYKTQVWNVNDVVVEKSIWTRASSRKSLTMHLRSQSTSVKE